MFADERPCHGEPAFIGSHGTPLSMGNHVRVPDRGGAHCRNTWGSVSGLCLLDPYGKGSLGHHSAGLAQIFVHPSGH